MKNSIIKILAIIICIIIVVVAILSVMLKNNQKNKSNESENVRNYIVYDSEKESEIGDIEKDVSITGIVELHHNGFIYIFGGQHFGELGYEIEEYTTSNIDDTNQSCIDYLTLKEYDTSYIEEDDLIICSGDLIKKGSFNNDFKTKGSIVVLKSDDYNQMKSDTICGKRTFESTIVAGFSAILSTIPVCFVLLEYRSAILRAADKMSSEKLCAGTICVLRSAKSAAMPSQRVIPESHICSACVSSKILW